MIDTVEQHIVNETKRLFFENELLMDWIRSLNGVPRCAVCGKPVYNASIQRLLRPFHWDTRRCFEFKPRKIVALEKEYGMDIVEILKLTTEKYGKIKAQCQALNISPPYFYDIVKRYCGDVVEFMAKHASGRRKQEYVDKLKLRSA
ncbi:MAG: hypothetical protein WC444_05480 [Candidatus Paceibacterota bacterium]